MRITLSVIRGYGEVDLVRPSVDHIVGRMTSRVAERSTLCARPALLKMSLSMCLSACLMVCLSLSASTTEARDHKWGIGLILGWPSGIAGQAKLGSAARLNAALSYDLRDPSVGGHLDQIFLSRRAYFRWFYPYIGWGGRVALGRDGKGQRRISDDYEWSGVALGARLPLGVEFGRNRWRGLLEVSPTLDLIPSPQLLIGGSLGARYHF
jgi:hypothetical protein